MKSFKTLYILLLILIFVPPVSLAAFDFGLLTHQNAGYGSREGGENNFDYQANIVPRFSFLFGEQSDFSVSAGITLGADGEFYCIPELGRTVLSLRSGGWGIKAGRMNYSDPLAFIAAGLFDGVQFYRSAKTGTFNAGVWYTGLLYKKNRKDNHDISRAVFVRFTPGLR